MFKDLLESIFSRHSDWVERILGIMLLALAFLLVGLVGLLIYTGIDEMGVTPSKSAVTVVVDKNTVPAHTTSGLLLVGKVTVPTTTHHPESYHLHFQVNGATQDFAVDKDFFDQIEVGQKIRVSYGFGRLSGSVTIASVAIAQ